MSRYIETESGDWLDTETNLVWKREPEANRYDYYEALDLQQYGWRLPSIKELLTIVDHSAYGPATSLPNHTDERYWSASPYAGLGDNAWGVFFGDGRTNDYLSYEHHQVRLVRNNEEVTR
jgi:hypothetical protein